MNALDASLIANARGDDARAKAAAYEALYARHQRLVAGVCRRVCRSAADVDDAVQETFVAAFRYLDTFRGECAFSTWLARIAMRTAVRVVAKQPMHEELEESQRDPSHGQLAEASSSAVLAGQLLRRLPQDTQLVLVLFAIEGLAHAEIAEILGVPVGTVWSRLHAARKAAAGLLSQA